MALTHDGTLVPVNANTVVPFHSDAFTVRAILLDDDPWFVASEVCRQLEHTNTTVALRMLDADEIRQIRRSEALNLSLLFTDARVESINLISESGFYNLALRSKARRAAEFRRWVTREVLPALLRTGTYSATPAPTPTPALPSRRELAAMVIEAEDRADAEAARADEAEAVVRELAPAADAWAAMVDATGEYTVKQAAQILSSLPGVEVGQNRLMQRMRELSWIDGRNRPYQRQIGVGRLTAKARPWTDSETGEIHVRYQPFITGKGLDALRVDALGQGQLALGA